MFVAAIFCVATASAKCRIVSLSNKVAEVGICVEHGRIIVFKLVGGSNVLWRNTGSLKVAFLRGWNNYGGDKVWLIPQNMRPSAFGNRLPDPDIDGKTWKILKQTKSVLTIRSSLSKTLGCYVVRKIQLDPVAAVVMIDNQVVQKEKTPFPVHIWQVSQMIKPEFAMLGLDNKAFPDRKTYFLHRGKKSRSKITVINEFLKIILPENGWDKINAFGEWLAAAGKDVIFIQAAKLESNKPYPENSSIQIYGNEKYIEMETLSPLVHLKPGEKYGNHVVWGLLKTKKDNKIRDFAKSELRKRIK